uniref:Uncharacterized protein n=1 Tax=Chlamydomonas leiostraca TaxID=1034604 RepID=A0A7S0X1P5_9CHLO
MKAATVNVVGFLNTGTVCALSGLEGPAALAAVVVQASGWRILPYSATQTLSCSSLPPCHLRPGVSGVLTLGALPARRPAGRLRRAGVGGVEGTWLDSSLLTSCPCTDTQGAVLRLGPVVSAGSHPSLGPWIWRCAKDAHSARSKWLKCNMEQTFDNSTGTIQSQQQPQQAAASVSVL